MKSCDCLIGLLHNEQLLKSSVTQQIYWGMLRYNNTVKLVDYRGDPLTVQQYMDGRRGIVTKFKFCPRCGTEINWKEITDSLVREMSDKPEQESKQT